MEYKIYNDEEDYLSHHGILGQRWGIRRYQNKDGSLTALGKKLRGTLIKEDPLEIGDIYSVSGKNGSLSYQQYKKFASSKKEVRDEIIRLSEDNFRKNEKSLTKNQRAGLKWSIDLMKKRNDELEYNNNVKGPDDLPKKKKEYYEMDDIKSANPTKDNHNCMYCSVIYDLRRRGFDVTARRRESGGSSFEICDYYKDGDKVLKNYYGKGSKEALLNDVKAMPRGAHGIMTGTSLKFGGHSFNFKKLTENYIAIIDTQTGKIYPEKFLDTFQYYELMRTDNLEPNWNRIGETINPDDLKKR